MLFIIFFEMRGIITGQGISISFKRKALFSLAIFGGTFVGYISARAVWNDKKHLFQTNNLTEYECEDNINSLIEETRKPAVIYYYLPAYSNHYVMRANMLKYSNLYPNNAIWVMVNLTQDFQRAQEALKTVIYPQSDIRLEVRFPKDNIAIFENVNQKELKLVKQIYGNRRQVYNYNIYQPQFQAFLEQNKIIQGFDPMKPTLKLTQQALFQDVDKK